MSSTSEERCPKCGGTLGASLSGSITQWIAVCSCALRTNESTPVPRMQICGRCGKRLPSGRSGSFTQWVFRQDLCACREPIISKLDVERLPFQIGETSIPINEIALDIAPAKFPFERYFPIREIGKGGSGVVYYCRDRLLDKIVAVKILHALSARELLSFQNEARATSRLKHPNIVGVMDFGATPAGVPFMAIEYVDGVSMQQLIADGNLFDSDTVVELFCKVADGLSHAHKVGILHRDITTSNLLILRNQRGEPDVRIIDFGVSILGFAQNGQGQTIVGTPRYMPPDQARGEDYDERSEVYEFGCSLFEALTGDTPFLGATSLDLMRQHAEEPAPRLSDRRPDGEFSEELEELVARCLDKDKAERFQSMSAVAEALDDLCVRSARFEDEPAKPFDVFARKGGYVFASLLVVSGVVLALRLGLEIFRNSEKLTEEKALNVPDHGIFGSVLVDAASETLRPRFEVRKRHDIDWTIAKGNVTNDSLVELSGRTDIKRLSLLADPVDGRALIFALKLPLVGLDLDQTQMRDQDVDIICRFKLLESLGIAHTNITEKGLAGLANLPKLVDLQVGGPLLNDQGLSAVSRLDKLRCLSLRDTKEVTASGIAKLGTISKLETLTLKNLNVGPEIMKAVSGIKQLSHLRVYDNKFPENSFKPLFVANIKDIKLTRSSLTDDHLLQIAEMKSLRSLVLDQTRGFSQEGLSSLKKKNPQCEIWFE